LGALSALPAAVALLTGVPAAVAVAAVTATVRACLLNNTNVGELRSWSFQGLCHLESKVPCNLILLKVRKFWKQFVVFSIFLPL
jgi:hypothetical protein